MLFTMSAWSLFDEDEAPAAPPPQTTPAAPEPSYRAVSTLHAEQHGLLMACLKQLKTFTASHGEGCEKDLSSQAGAGGEAGKAAADILAGLAAQKTAIAALWSALERHASGSRRSAAADDAAGVKHWQELEIAARRVDATTSQWLGERKAWPHVAWREAHVIAQLAACVCCIARAMPATGPGVIGLTTASSDGLHPYRQALRHLDLALIMGAPAQELVQVVELVESMVRVLVGMETAAAAKARSAAAAAAATPGGGGGSVAAAPAAARLPTVPAVLGADAVLDLPAFDAEHAVPRVLAATNGELETMSQGKGVNRKSKSKGKGGAASGRGAASGGAGVAAAAAAAAEEHPELAKWRELTPIPGATAAAKPLTVANFRKQYAKASKPVVLHGALDWRALTQWRDLNYLASKYGHRLVPIEVGQHLSAHWHEETCLLSEFISRYVAPSVVWGWGAGRLEAQPPSDALPQPAVDAAAGVVRVPYSHIAYLPQHMLFEQIPGLLEDLDVPLYAGSGADGTVGAVNAWFGTAGTVTRAHTDSYDNILTQVFGYKFLRLYAPSDSAKLYPEGSPAAAAPSSATASSTGGAGSGAAAAEQDASLLQGAVSRVDVEARDAGAAASQAASFPLFATAHHWDVVLGPGDALFIPKGWWHYARAITPSFSINFWW